MSTTKTASHQPIPQEAEQTGKSALDAALKVHSTLGPGLLESVYEKALQYELTKNNISTKPQVTLPIIYDGHQLDANLYCDLIVQDSVILELKSVETVIPLYQAQLLTYLKLSNLRLGYLLNFNVLHLKDGIKRMVN